MRTADRRPRPARETRRRRRRGRTRGAPGGGEVLGSPVRLRARGRQSSLRAGPGWHVGHQYAVRLSSPWPRESIGVLQRGQGRPAARRRPAPPSLLERPAHQAALLRRARRAAPRRRRRPADATATTGPARATAFQRFPIPATSRWSSRALRQPSAGHCAGARRACDRSPADGRGCRAPAASRLGHSARHRSAPHDSLPRPAPQHEPGRPRVSAPRSRTVQRPFIRR